MRRRHVQFITPALIASLGAAASLPAWASEEQVEEQQPVYQQPAPVQQAPQPVYQAPPAQPSTNNNNNVVVEPGQQAPAPAPGETVVQPGTTVVQQQPVIVEHEYRNAFLFDAGALIGGQVNLEYEAALARYLGVTLGLGVNSYRGAFEPKTEGSFVSFGPEIGVRFHFIQAAPAGLWIGPLLSAQYVAWRDTSKNTNGSTNATATFAYELGAAVGYNIVIDHFLLSLGVGGGFGDNGYGVRWDPRFRLGVGAVF